MRNRKKGFSLIELLIVVAIILIIAAIGSLRAINTACITYSTIYGTGYPALLANLGPGAPATAATSDLIDSVLAAGTKSGYVFTYTAGAAVGGTINTYTLTAVPANIGTTGQRQFFTNESGVIRANPSGAADVNSTPIG